MSDALRVVVLVSGNGSNLQALIDGATAGDLPIDIRAVVSNRLDAFALTRAEEAGIGTEFLSHRDYANREDYDAALCGLIDGFAPELVVLAGFMRILTPGFVEHYAGRLINIHPSLLPAYRGLHTHERVLEAGDRHHGCSVHYVTPELDAGPVILQAEIDVQPNDTPRTLARRIQREEHRIYPIAVRWIAEKRVAMVDGEVRFDGVPRAAPPRLRPETDPTALLRRA